MEMEQGVSQLSATIEYSAEPRLAKAPTAPARLTVEIRNDFDLGPEDVAALEALIESRPQVGIFLSKAWLSGFFVEPPPGVEPFLLLFREGRDLCGVAPIAVRHTRTHVRVSLLGGEIGSDRVDLLTARGFEAACSDTFVAWLGEAFGERAFVFELRDVPADSPLWGAVHRANAERTPRLALQPREIYSLPYLDLTESSSRIAHEAFPRGHSLRSLDKHRRWLERRGRLRIEMLQDPGEVMAAFDSLAEFLHARWHDQQEGSVLDNPRVRRFHRHAILSLLGDGCLRMIRLSSDMRTIAVFYGLASSRWWGYYLAGYDRQWAGRIHLGQITLATAIDLASREGATEFDFLKGAERVKYLWPVRERSSLDADAYSAKSGSQFTRAVWATREAASALVKSARDLFSTPAHP
jgi:CelD/BcsL family acetyltransferase involved in cellulose biosynthesis